MEPDVAQLCRYNFLAARAWWRATPRWRVIARWHRKLDAAAWHAAWLDEDEAAKNALDLIASLPTRRRSPRTFPSTNN